MILTREQINRYLRHIIIPEISGAGQKKLIDAKIFIHAGNVEEASALLYYVVALGIGSITCSFINKEGYDKLLTEIHELNSQVHIELVEDPSAIENSNAQYDKDYLVRVVIGEYIGLKDCFSSFTENMDCIETIPMIVAANSGWKAFFQTIQNHNQMELDCIVSRLEVFDSSSRTQDIYEKQGSVLSACLLGALTAIECVKLCLNIGTIVATPIYFDLLAMNFNRLAQNNQDIAITDNNFDNESKGNQQKYNATKKLSDSKVLIVGTGGLGSPAAFALASLGIGTIGFVDFDEVDVSNLNRQIIHSTAKIGMSKVESAKLFINNLNPNINTILYNTSLNTDNAIDIIKDYDVVLDCVDNFPARYLINDACYFANKPLVDAAAVQFCGLIMTIMPKEGPCYRCLFPAITGQNGTMSCSEAGVLGPVPGVMGFLQATEAVKLLLGVGKTLQNRIIYYDALESDFDTINTMKSMKCDLCGTNPTINALVEYKNSCEL